MRGCVVFTEEIEIQGLRSGIQGVRGVEYRK